MEKSGFILSREAAARLTARDASDFGTQFQYGTSTQPARLTEKDPDKETKHCFTHHHSKTKAPCPHTTTVALDWTPSTLTLWSPWRAHTHNPQQKVCFPVHQQTTGSPRSISASGLPEWRLLVFLRLSWDSKLAVAQGSLWVRSLELPVWPESPQQSCNQNRESPWSVSPFLILIDAARAQLRGSPNPQSLNIRF